MSLCCLRPGESGCWLWRNRGMRLSCQKFGSQLRDLAFTLRKRRNKRKAEAENLFRISVVCMVRGIKTTIVKITSQITNWVKKVETCGFRAYTFRRWGPQCPICMLPPLADWIGPQQEGCREGITGIPLVGA